MLACTYTKDFHRLFPRPKYLSRLEDKNRNYLATPVVSQVLLHSVLCLSMLQVATTLFSPTSNTLRVSINHGDYISVMSYLYLISVIVKTRHVRFLFMCNNLFNCYVLISHRLNLFELFLCGWIANQN